MWPQRGRECQTLKTDTLLQTLKQNQLPADRRDKNTELKKLVKNENKVHTY